MTFETYFQQCQTLITKEIDLPFDVPFGVQWTDKYHNDFVWYYLNQFTPKEAVIIHFAIINNKAEQLKIKRKTTK